MKRATRLVPKRKAAKRAPTPSEAGAATFTGHRAKGPSDLKDAVSRHLAKVEDGDANAVRSLVSTLTTLLGVTWSQWIEGDAEAPSQAMKALLPTQAFVERQLATPLDPRVEAATALNWTWLAVSKGAEVAQESKVETQLKNKQLSAPERELIRVLLTEEGNVYLARGELHARMQLDSPVTPQRVGQVAKRLADLRILLVQHRTMQGSESGAAYALSIRGRELAGRLGLVAEKRPAPIARKSLVEAWGIKANPGKAVMSGEMGTLH